MERFISKRMKYRKKPVIIEAIQFEDNSDRIIEIHEFMGGDTIRVNYEDKDNPYLKIETLEGIMKASVGDYIIKGVNGGGSILASQIYLRKLIKE